MIVSAQDCLTLAKTVYGEARGESYQGQCEVAWTVINRLASGRWYGRRNLAETCLVPYQYSCWNPDDPNRLAMDGLTLDDSVFQVSMCAALASVHSIVLPHYPGMTHYFVTGTSTPEWAKGKTPEYVVGKHEFYSGIN